MTGTSGGRGTSASQPPVAEEADERRDPLLSFQVPSSARSVKCGKRWQTVTNGDKSETTRKESVRAGWPRPQFRRSPIPAAPVRAFPQRNARPRPTAAEQLTTTFTTDIVRTGEAVKRYHHSFEGRLDGAGGLHSRGAAAHGSGSLCHGGRGGDDRPKLATPIASALPAALDGFVRWNVG